MNELSQLHEFYDFFLFLNFCEVWWSFTKCINMLGQFAMRCTLFWPVLKHKELFFEIMRAHFHGLLIEFLVFQEFFLTFMLS